MTRSRHFIPLVLLAMAESLAAAPQRPLGFFDGDPLPPRTVYLTFDDGPGEFTSDFLDLLERERVHATFFLCARWAKEHWAPNMSAYDQFASVLERMSRDGHCIGNHTADHQSFTMMSQRRIERELSRNQMLLDWAIGPDKAVLTIARPPFGLPWGNPTYDCSKANAAFRNRSLVFMWNKWAYATDANHYVKGEWYTKAKTDPETPEFKAKVRKIVDLYRRLADGRSFVTLMHDTHPTTLAALPEIIADLRAKQYTFATAEDWVVWRYGKPSAALLQERR